MERTGATVALDKGNNGLLGGGLAGGAIAGLAADIGFIGLDNAIGSAERAGGSRAVHGFADTVAEEPCGAIGDAQHALNLLGAHSLL